MRMPASKTKTKMMLKKFKKQKKMTRRAKTGKHLKDSHWIDSQSYPRSAPSTEIKFQQNTLPTYLTTSSSCSKPWDQ